MVNVNLEIDDEVINFNLPENWDEITIGEFVKIFSFDREGLSLLEVVIQTISLLTGVDEEKLFMISIEDFNKLAVVLDFINKELEPVDVDYVELNGEKYYVKKDFNTFTMGEIISVETILSQADNNLFKVMDKLLCIFLRKKKENGKLETFKGQFMERSELFRTAPISKVFNIFNFFLNGGNLLLDNMNQSLENPPKKKKKEKINLKELDNK